MSLSNVYYSGVARILVREVLKVSHRHEATGNI